MYLPMYAKFCDCYRKFEFFKFLQLKNIILILKFWAENLPELINCIPIQKEITYLWHDMAKNKNHADFDV